MKMNLPNDPGNTQLLLHELPAACKTPGPVGWAGVMAVAGMQLPHKYGHVLGWLSLEV